MFGAVVLALALFGIVRRPLQRSMKLLPSALLAVPVLLILVLAPLQSLFVDVYFSVILAPLALATALGLARVMRQWTTLLVPAGLVLASLGLAVTSASGGMDSSQGWRELPSMMAGTVMAGDVIAFPNSYYRIVAEYYAVDPGTGPYPPGDPTLPTDMWSTLRPYQLDLLKRTGGQTSPEVFEPQILNKRRVWLVGLGDTFNRTVREDLEARGYLLDEIFKAGNAEARLYVAA